MNLYSVALFAHILGVLGLFIGMGLQWTITLRLRQARTAAQVREWSTLISGAGKLGPASGALLLVAGIYMMVVSWGLTPWIVVSLAAMLVMMVLGMGVTARRLKAIQRAALADVAADGISPTIQRRIHDPVLWIATQMAGSAALGVVFLMTTKPGWGGSLLALAVALVAGSVIGGLSAKSRRPPVEVEELLDPDDPAVRRFRVEYGA